MVAAMAHFRLPYRMGPRRPGRRLGRHWTYAGLAALAISLLLLADRGGLFGHANQPDWDKYQGKVFAVAKVVDGDTLDLDVPDGRHSHTRIRLLGVDTPETVAPDKPVGYFGPQASAFAKKTALGRNVTVELDRTRTRDKYDRLLAYLLLEDGEDLSLLLIRQGYGYADPRFAHPMVRQCKTAQTEAMKNSRGLWAGVHDADLPYYYQGKLKLPGDKK
jgi:micrococcal nuclease